MEYKNQTDSTGNDAQNQTSMPVEPAEGTARSQPQENYAPLSVSILISSLVLAGAWMYTSDRSVAAPPQKASVADAHASALEEKVLPREGVVLPARWGDVGAKLVSVGAIDADKFTAIYSQRGAFTDEYKKLLLGDDNGNLKITEENAGYLLNLLWALGLANKNSILETGEMTDPRYGGAGNFASTGGWTLARGGAMEHYSRHKFFNLTDDEQALVERVSRGIYRPCCGNSTHFPDCNHGMAMLGLLELMASQGVSEEGMWKAALAANSYWFPETYLTIATYMESKGVDWDDVNPQEMLGVNYSSSSGYARVASQVAPQRGRSGGGGCGVGTEEATPPPRQQSGCGV